MSVKRESNMKHNVTEDGELEDTFAIKFIA